MFPSLPRPCAAGLIFIVAVAGALAGVGAIVAVPTARGESPPSAVPGDAVAADPFAGAARLELAAVVAAAVERNRDLDAARLAWRAAAERPAVASALPDPMVAAGIAPLSIASEDVPFGISVEARQELPYPGKRALAGRAAAATAEAAAAEWASLRLDVARQAAQLWLDLARIDRELTVNDQHVALLGELLETATHRYAAGLAPQQAPLQAEVELTHLVHQRVELETDRAEVAARLNALLHRPVAAPLPPLGPLPAVAPVAGEQPAMTGHAMPGRAAGGAAASEPPRPSAPDGGSEAGADLEPADPALADALAVRPEMAAATAELRARELERELATRERQPDFGVTTSYSSMWRESAHRWMAGVTVSLPIWRQRIRAGEAAAEAERAAAAARREAVADRVAAEVAAAGDRLAEMRHVVGLYESRLLPASRDQVEAARSGLTTGAVAFTTVIEAEKNLRSVELDYEVARVDLVRRRIDLDRALGRSPAGVELPPSDPSIDPPAPAAVKEGP